MERSTIANAGAGAGAVGRVRRVVENGREYLVAPLSLIVPGVLAGSKGALYYPPDEIARNHTVWDGTPIVVYHPHDPLTNQPQSVWDRGVIERAGVGEVRSSRVQGGSGVLRAEGWFDSVRTREVDPRVHEALVKGRHIELSTGLYTDNHSAPLGSVHVTPRGPRGYDYIARNYRPDHVAILPDQVGACSVKDGCGVFNQVAADDGSNPPNDLSNGPSDDHSDDPCTCSTTTNQDEPMGLMERFVSWLTGNVGVTERVTNTGDGKPGFDSEEQQQAFFGLKKASDESESKKEGGGKAEGGKGESVHPAVERALSRMTHVTRSDQAEQQGRNHYQNDGQARKDFKDHKEFGKAVKAEYEKRQGGGKTGGGTHKSASEVVGGFRSQSTDKGVRLDHDYEGGKKHIESHGGEMVSAKRGIDGRTIETWRVKAKDKDVLATWGRGGVKVGHDQMPDRWQLQTNTSTPTDHASPSGTSPQGEGSATGNAGINQPRHGDSGQYLPHGAGTGKGPAHKAATRGGITGRVTMRQVSLGHDALKQLQTTGHNPASWVQDEDKWEKAKEQADKGDYDKESGQYWAVVTHIYENMGGEIKEGKGSSKSTTNANPEGCNQFKSCEGGGGGSEGISSGKSDKEHLADFKASGGTFRKVGGEVHAEHPSHDKAVKIRDDRKYNKGFTVYTSGYGGEKGTERLETVHHTAGSLKEAKHKAARTIMERPAANAKYADSHGRPCDPDEDEDCEEVYNMGSRISNKGPGFESKEQRDSFFGAIKDKGEYDPELGGESAKSVGSKLSDKAVSKSNAVSAFSGKADDAKGHREAAIAHDNARLFHERQGNTKLASSHGDAANYHHHMAEELQGRTERWKAEEKRSSGGGKTTGKKLRGGTENMANLPREELLDYISLNCDCSDDDRAALNGLSDTVLGRIANATSMGKAQGSNASTVTGRGSTPSLEEQTDDGDMDGDEAQTDDDMTQEARSGSRDDRSRMKSNRYTSNSRRRTVTLDHNGRMPLDDFMEIAPEQVHNLLSNAMQVEQQARTRLVKGLTEHLADGPQKRSVVNRLKGKTIDELQDLALIQPTGNRQRMQLPQELSYLGAAAPLFNGGRTQADRDDYLALPTMNWGKDEDS